MKVDPQASMDSAFYHIMVNQLGEGKGFSVPIIWHHLRNYKQIIHPMDYWMPFGIIYYYLARIIGGVNFEITFNILIWSMLSVFIFFDTYKITRNALSSFVAYFTFVFCGKQMYYCLTTDNNAFYALLGYLLIKAMADKKQNVLITGLVGGLMTLTRIEGSIFAFLGALWQAHKSGKLKTFFMIVGIVLIVVSPWMIRNKQVLNTWWPSNSKALFLTSYDDIFDANFKGSPKEYFNKGIKWILKSKFDGFKGALTGLIAVPGMLVFYPFWILGIISLWKKEGKVFGFLMSVFLALCTLVFTYQSTKGTALHISSAFIPHISIILGSGLNFLFEEKKIRRSIQVFTCSIIILWAIVFTYNSLCYLKVNYENDNIPYKQLFSKYKIPSNEGIVSFYPIYVYFLNRNSGVMVSGMEKDSPGQIAKKYNCKYILTDSRAFLDVTPKNMWSLIASSTYNLKSKPENNKAKRIILHLYQINNTK